MSGESNFDSTEKQLRSYIRNAFERTGGAAPDAEMRSIEDGVLALMEAYFQASPQMRETVYKKYEEQLLETVGSLGRDYRLRRF